MGISHVFTSPIADGTNTQLVKPSDWNSSHAYTLQDAVSLSGNTAGVLANISSGTLYLAGGNNITLSQQGNSVTLSGANVGGAQTGISGIIGSDATYTSGTVQFTGSNMVTVKSSAGQRFVIDATQSVQTQMTGLTAGMSTEGNTLGTTGLVSNRLVLVGGNNITLSQSVNGQSATLTISAFTALTSQSTDFNAITLGGNTAGTTTFHATNNRSIFLHGGNNITLSGNGSSITISAFTQTVQTQMTGLTAGMSTNGNTSGDTGLVSNRLVLIGGNNITLSGSTNAGSMSITISGPNAGGAQTGISGISVSDTMYTSGSVTFRNANGISFGSSGAQGISASYTVPTQTVQTLEIYALGQTTGQSSRSTYDARTLSIEAAGIISAGWSNSSFRISATQETTPPIATTVGSVATANSVGTVTRFAPEDHKHEGVYAAGVSNIGNTSGNTTVQPGRLVLAGGNNIVLSVSTAANALQTVTISASLFVGTRIAPTFLGKLQGASQTSPQSSLYIYPLHPHMPVFGADVTLKTLNILMSGNIANSSSATMTYSIGFYTWANSSAMSLAFFATSTFGQTSATNQSTAFQGIRWWSFQSSQFSNSASNATTPIFNASGEYYIAHLWNTSNQAKGLSWVGGSVWVPSGVLSGSMGQNTTTGNTSMNLHPGWGVYSTGAMPAVISLSSVNATAGTIYFVPYVEIEGLATGF